MEKLGIVSFFELNFVCLLEVFPEMSFDVQLCTLDPILCKDETK
jgi:hypothetical protein